MLVSVYEEVWPWPIKKDSQPKMIGPVGAGDGYEAARAIAKAMAEKFDHSKYEGEFDYWYGHNEGAPDLHRYVIGAV
jgi:hypothetical protein